jgi:outer membrane immunogenic protein
MKWGAVIGGIGLAALAALPARAADMTVSPRAIPASSGYIPAQFFWTGFYLGAGIGGDWGTATFVDPFSGATASPSLKGFLVSGVSGINYQINWVVIGVEADFTGTWAKGTAADAAVPPNPGNSLTVDVFWTGSFTGRVGWAFDRLLIYGKGGVGFAYDRDTVGQSSSGGSAIGSTYRTAWTVGGGVEYALTEHWTGRLEYDFFKFPSKGFTFQGNTTPAMPASGGQVGFNLNEIKAIMAYKF